MMSRIIHWRCAVHIVPFSRDKVMSQYKESLSGVWVDAVLLYIHYFINVSKRMYFDCSFKWQAGRTRNYREDMVDCFDEDHVFEQLIGLRDHDF